MLSFEGNTAPYMQYAYTRIRSIFNRSQIALSEVEQAQLSITDEKERALAIKLLQFEEAIQIVAKDGTPHVLCAYLYELAGVFSSFYEHCPILNNEDQQVKLSRLKLALLTERTLKQGLDLLGIKPLRKCNQTSKQYPVHLSGDFFINKSKLSILRKEDKKSAS